jgi:hypothetical protein
VRQDRLTIYVLKCDIGCVWQPILLITVNEAMADPLDQTSLNVVAQSADACLFCLEMRGGKLRSLAKPDDCRRVLRATPPAAFLMTPPNERFVLYAFANI